MDIFEVLFLSVGLAMDAFAVSVCKGLAAKKVTIKEYLLCGLWFGSFQAIMPFIGFLVGTRFEKIINIIAPWLAFALLAFIGGKMIKEAFDNDEEVKPGFDIKTMFLMAVATSIDALAVGITFVAYPANVLKMGVLANVVFTVILIGVITLIISMIGVWIGKKFGDKFKKGAEIAGGVILILIGVRTIIEYLFF
jgi:putative Mn2+ efflux pump MntP